MAGIGLERIGAFVMAVPDLVGARECFVRLGLSVTAPAAVGITGLERCRCTLGAPERSVPLELVSVRDRNAVAEAGHDGLAQILDAGGGPYRLGLEVADVDVARSVLNAQANAVDERLLTMPDGSVVRVLDPGDTSVAGCQYVIVDRQSGGDHPPTGKSHSGFPMKRVDHIALLPPEIEAGTRHWTDVLGVAVHA